MKRVRFTEERIIGVLREHEAGAKTADLARKHGISEATLYNWKAKYGGLDVSGARRLRGLQYENRKLKKLFRGIDARQRRVSRAVPWSGRAAAFGCAIALSWRDTPDRRFEWQHCAATPVRLSTLPAQADEQPPALNSPAREGARFPPVLQTRDNVPKAVWPIVQTSPVIFPLLSGTILSLPPAVHRPLAQHPRSLSLPRLQPRTVAAHLVLPRPVDLVRTMAPAQTRPERRFRKFHRNLLHQSVATHHLSP